MNIGNALEHGLKWKKIKNETTNKMTITKVTFISQWWTHSLNRGATVSQIS